MAVCGRIKLSIRGLRGLVDLIREPIVEHIDAGSDLATTLDQGDVPLCVEIV